MNLSLNYLFTPFTILCRCNIFSFFWFAGQGSEVNLFSQVKILNNFIDLEKLNKDKAEMIKKLTDEIGANNAEIKKTTTEISEVEGKIKPMFNETVKRGNKKITDLGPIKIEGQLDLID